MEKEIKPYTMKKIAIWAMTGWQCPSSKSIVRAVLDDDDANLKPYPQDFYDFYRCSKLIEYIPEIKNEAFERLKNLSNQWRQLIDRWDEISKVYDICLSEHPSKRTNEKCTNCDPDGKVESIISSIVNDNP